MASPSVHAGLARIMSAWGLTALLAVPVAGQEAGVPLTDAAVPAPGAQAAPDVRVERIRSLLAGELHEDIDPQSLFELPLSDEAALQVEAARLRALLRAAEEAAQPLPPDARSRRSRARPAGLDASTLRADMQVLDPSLWRARLELDRARLQFYALSREQRDQLLEAHEARREAARTSETEEERRLRDARDERERALAAARAARSELERLVAEELARLIAVEARVALARDRIRDAKLEIVARQDVVLGWQRRVRTAKAEGATLADRTYDSLRLALRASRGELADALDVLQSERSEVPAIGPDALADIPLDVPAEHVRQRRRSLERAIVEARRGESALREERAAVLVDEIGTLNRERLDLLSRLSAAKRSAITGFTPAAWDQARSEARHLGLVLRYHRHVARAWLGSLHAAGPAAISPWAAGAVAVEWLLLILAFSWARRQTPKLLRLAELRARELDRAERRLLPGRQRRAVRFLAKIHRPLEWLALFGAMIWLVPVRARGLIELQLLASIVGWVLCGALVVNAINALAATGARSLHDEDAVGAVRLRSLRLVGHTVVAFGLILVLSARLVGEGTIYRWVFSTCWFAAVPIFLLLVRWWRPIVFQRLERTRKKTRLQTWVLSNRSGWKSFLAAMLGAVQLFGAGATKTILRSISGFDLTRRAHAYLFKREIDRLSEGQQTTTLKPLPSAALDALHPEREGTRWLACPGDALLEELARRATERRGGLVAIIGARGMGKSSLLRALSARVEGAAVVSCGPHTTLDEIRRQTSTARAAAPAALPLVVLIEDAHAVVRPVIGGLHAFDELISLARARCADTTWVFAIDAAVWALLKRARDARPLFDEVQVLRPWNEGEIGALLADRCQQAGISPIYDDLLEKLPPGADDLDRFDALQEKRLGYERMLWDHVRGNPGLALEAWRASLAEDTNGAVHVRPLQLPDTSKLDRLPDSLLFILRAVLQLAPAAVDDVAEATRLSPDQVLDAFRFGQTQGILAEQNGRVWVSWRWLRPVVRLLERRHLLVSP